MEVLTTAMNGERLNPPNGEFSNFTGHQTPMGIFEESEDIAGSPRASIISYKLFLLMRTVIDLWISSALSYLGIVGNIVAIVVFTKMGFQDTMNITLVTIAFWDLAKNVCSAILRLYGPIQLFSPALAHTWYTYAYIIVGFQFSTTGYVSGVLAAYVAIERCLCVSRPFTVKFLLTPKVVTCVNVVISILVFTSYMMVYARFEFVWVYNPIYNATVAEFMFSRLDRKYPWIGEITNTMFVAYPIVSFFIICVCTVIIIYHLRKASKIRSTTTNSAGNKNPKQISSRDKQVTKMLLVIITVYIVSYLPRLVFHLLMATIPDYHPMGAYSNMLLVHVYIMSVFDLFNGAVNPLIFFFMSSQFKNTLTKMFSWSGETK